MLTPGDDIVEIIASGDRKRREREIGIAARLPRRGSSLVQQAIPGIYRRIAAMAASTSPATSGSLRPGRASGLRAATIVQPRVVLKLAV